LRTPLSDVAVEELEVRSLTDAQIDEINAFRNVLWAETFPENSLTSNEHARAGYRNVPPFIIPRECVVRDAQGSIVAWSIVSWELAETNQHLVNAQIEVHPDHRRRGIGSVLFARALEIATTEGKRMIFGRTVDRVPSGEAFAERIGMRKGMIGHTNQLLLADVDRSTVERWVEEGPVRAAGYSLVQIDGRIPDDLIQQVTDCRAVMNTAPTEDLEVDDWIATVETERAIEASMLETGNERRLVLARHDSSGDLVGFSELWRHPHNLPETCWQWGTGVFPDHRGHALGKWMKAVNVLRVLDEWPEAVDIRTHNADSNDPMLGINNALGFKPFTVDINWQISVDEAKKYVDAH
jgi:mycothiol synthase